jgi:hypothetical protein
MPPAKKNSGAIARKSTDSTIKDPNTANGCYQTPPRLPVLSDTKRHQLAEEVASLSANPEPTGFEIALPDEQASKAPPSFGAGNPAVPVINTTSRSATACYVVLGWQSAPMLLSTKPAVEQYERALGVTHKSTHEFFSGAAAADSCLPPRKRRHPTE